MDDADRAPFGRRALLVSYLSAGYTARRRHPHLVVSAAPGVQLLSRLPRDLRKPPLVGRVDVLVSRLVKASSVQLQPVHR